MTTPTPNEQVELLKELYAIDPSLKEHEAFLPTLIENLAQARPAVVINPAFVADLRASLLSYKPAPPLKPATIVSPFLWWFTRLAPVGVALVLIVALMPHQTISPTIPNYPIQPSVENAPSNQGDVPVDTTGENPNQSIELFNTEAVPGSGVGATDFGVLEDTMMVKEAGPLPILLNPPQASSSLLTVATLTVPETGWVVVHEDIGGVLGAVLHSSRYESGVYTAQTLELTRPLTYPELVTLVVYTATTSDTFIRANEIVQADPVSGMPLMSTVPVVSELELELRN